MAPDRLKLKTLNDNPYNISYRLCFLMDNQVVKCLDINIQGKSNMQNSGECSVPAYYDNDDNIVGYGASLNGR